ncbi:MAG: TonB family protein [Limisphaerales bacterium]
MPGIDPEARAEKGAKKGTIAVLFKVSASGELTDIIVESSDVPESVQQEAIRKFSTWKFTPRKVDGVPIDSEFRAMFKFSESKRTRRKVGFPPDETVRILSAPL